MDKMITKEELLRRLQLLSFYAVDLNLFLDTHPDNQKALQDYKYVLEQIKKLEDLYEQRFGPLMNFSQASVSGDFWNWVSDDQPWPWENK